MADRAEFEAEGWRAPLEWWEIVLEDDFVSLDDIAREIGPEYAMWLEVLDEQR